MRQRFEQFIAGELDAKPGVRSAKLAQDFYVAEERLIRRVYVPLALKQLTRIAEEILRGSIQRDIARTNRPQMLLPLSLRGVALPGAYTCIADDGRVEHVANYKITKAQYLSHLEILRKNEQEVISSREGAERVYRTVERIWDDEMTLEQALAMIANAEHGAA